jgi:putative transposase
MARTGCFAPTTAFCLRLGESPRYTASLLDNVMYVHNRRSLRLDGYDYAQAGTYFVTVCTQDRDCLLGDMVDGEMQLNAYGSAVHEEWLRTAELRHNVELDAFTIMPNHLHGIVVITHGRGTARRAPTEQFGKPVANSIPTIVRAFKSASTRRINQIRNEPSTHVWQRNYYEHVVRNERELDKIREYIATNPVKWALDRENPQSTGHSAEEDALFDLK